MFFLPKKKKIISNLILEYKNKGNGKERRLKLIRRDNEIKG